MNDDQRLDQEVIKILEALKNEEPAKRPPGLQPRCMPLTATDLIDEKITDLRGEVARLIQAHQALDARLKKIETYLRRQDPLWDSDLEIRTLFGREKP